MQSMFNLVEEPWVPCAMEDGSSTLLGLRDALVDAHRVRGLFDMSPVVTIALHRLLLAVLHRNFGPESWEAWRDLWQAGKGRWDAAVLDSYFATWRERFYLFDEAHPFYQSKEPPFSRTDKNGKEKSCRTGVSKIAQELDMGATLFDHTVEEPPPTIPPARAARYLVAIHAFHVGGLGGSVTPILAVGGTAVLVPKFDPAEVLRLVEVHGVHGIMGVPTVHQMLLEHPDFETRDLSSLGVLISGGAPLPEALMQAYHERGLEMRQGYGLTEAAPGVTGMGPGDARRKPASVGRPCLYTDVKVVDDRGCEVPTGEVGELLCRGPNVMKGYWNRPDATAEVLVDGWLHSGDLARIDEDGYVTIAGRKKEMIISGGENVYPGEIEQILTNHPDVALAAVVGRPDDLWGEVPVAFVIPQPGRTPAPAELLACAAEHLAKYKVPRDLYVEPMLPMNAAGKILKSELVKRFQEEA